MVDEASPQEKKKIATHFILSSPPGQLKDVVSDVRKLVSASILDDDLVKNVVRQYNVENLVFSKDSQNKNVLLSTVTQVDPTHYLNCANKTTITYDHFENKILEENPSEIELDSKIEDMRLAIQSSMETHMAAWYSPGKYAFSVHGNDNGTITIHFSSKNINLSNYWSGSWRGTYTFSVKSTGSTDLKCNMKIVAHYFEDGNVQLNTDFPKKTKIVVGDAHSTAKSVVSAIEKIESAFHKGLEEFYANMKNSFKAMRLFYPKTGVPMDWRAVVHNLARETASRGNE